MDLIIGNFIPIANKIPISRFFSIIFVEIELIILNEAMRIKNERTIIITIFSIFKSINNEPLKNIQDLI